MLVYYIVVKLGVCCLESTFPVCCVEMRQHTTCWVRNGASRQHTLCCGNPRKVLHMGGGVLLVGVSEQSTVYMGRGTIDGPFLVYSPNPTPPLTPPVNVIRQQDKVCQVFKRFIHSRTMFTYLNLPT